MLLYSNLASLHFSNKYWITLNFAEIHIFRIYRPHTLLICIWFPWDTRVPTLAEVKRRRGARVSRVYHNRVCAICVMILILPILASVCGSLFLSLGLIN